MAIGSCAWLLLVSTVQAQDTVEMLQTSIVDDPTKVTANRRFLIFTSAGDQSNVAQWTSTANRSYDVVVVYYGGDDGDSNVSGDAVYRHQDSKFPNLKWYLEEAGQTINKYDAVAVWDDDLESTPHHIDNVFAEMMASNLTPTVFSPCHAELVYPFHSLQKHEGSGRARQVEFVEMNSPIFKPAFLQSFIASFDTGLKGCGTDVWYSYVCNNKPECAIGVSDTICVMNPVRADGTREILRQGSDAEREKYWLSVAKRLRIPSMMPESAYNETDPADDHTVTQEDDHQAKRGNGGNTLNPGFAAIVDDFEACCQPPGK